MAETVYIFGAGINHGVLDFNGLRPPLATNFFQQALKSDRMSFEDYQDLMKCVFDYIEQYWKLSIEKLRTEPFDLEECFTLIQLQAEDAYRQKDQQKRIKLLEVSFRLTAMFAEYLQNWDAVFASGTSAFRTLGEILYAEKPTIITFNYDTLLESTLELASGARQHAPASYTGKPPKGGVPDELLAFSNYNWNRPLAYGVKFDEIQLQQAGIPIRVSGDRFYSHPENQLYASPLLKLHGSLNWFYYSGIYRFPQVTPQQPTRSGRTLLYGGHWWFGEPPSVEDEYIEPFLITPVLYKDLTEDLYQKLWNKAREELTGCNRIVIGGYSFPPTDFHTKRLFLEAFKDRSPEEIVVINPDAGVIGHIKKLCHFRKPVLSCRDLDEFISLKT
jgi:hypothetical protein